MRICHPLHQITMENKDHRLLLEENKTYIVPDMFFAQIDQAHQNALLQGKKLLKYNKDISKKFIEYNGEDLTDKILIVMRFGAIGDLIFIYPIVKYLKKKYKGLKIYLLCNKNHNILFENLGVYDGIFELPTEMNVLEEKIGKHDILLAYYVIFEGMMDSQQAYAINAYDLHKQKFKIIEDIPLELDVNPEWKNKEIMELPKDRLKIGINFSASSFIRSWKPQYIVEFVNNWKIPNTIFYFFDTPNNKELINQYMLQMNNSNMQMINLTEYSSDLMTSIKYIAGMDAFLNLDSGICHLTAVFRKPQVILYGAFHSELRSLYYNNVIAINAMPQCPYAVTQYKGCFNHAPSCKLAKEYNRKYAPCMDLITPKFVLNVMYNMLETFEIIKKSDYGL